MFFFLRDDKIKFAYLGALVGIPDPWNRGSLLYVNIPVYFKLMNSDWSMLMSRNKELQWRITTNI